MLEEERGTALLPRRGRESKSEKWKACGEKTQRKLINSTLAEITEMRTLETKVSGCREAGVGGEKLN